MTSKLKSKLNACGTPEVCPKEPQASESTFQVHVPFCQWAAEAWRGAPSVLDAGEEPGPGRMPRALTSSPKLPTSLQMQGEGAAETSPAPMGLEPCQELK